MTKGVDVAITECSTYDIDPLYEALEKVCDAANMADVKDKVILLKPNILSDASSEKAITTHPEVVRALIRILFNKGAKEVYVGDSPGIHGPSFFPRTSGIGKVCLEEGAKWCEFAREPVMTNIPGVFKLKLPLPKIMDEVDMIISVAKMKTHQLMYSTGSVKNIFGMVAGLHKSACHMRYPTSESFAKMLSGLYSVIKPTFAIMDAIVAMEGAGPAAGIPRHVGLLLASNDPTALDVSQSIIMGYDPFTIPLTNSLLSRRLTKWRSLEDINYPLLDANELIIQDYKKIELREKESLIGTLILPLLTRKFKMRHRQKEPKPLFDRSICIGCNKCVEICPAIAIILDKERKAVCNYSKCIRCYCCHEVCPVNAIEIEKREVAQ